MKITLPVNGRNRTFSEKELIAIVENHFAYEATKQELKTAQVVKKPIEGKWFEVNPQAIDQNLFQERREDEGQERTRLLILEAFTELKNNPKKYCRTFETMMPKKDWSYKTTAADLHVLASELGDCNADWVEQSLEWAQRICNGESWEAVCNNSDTANWERFVVGKNGHTWIVGDSRNNYNPKPASFYRDYSSYGTSYKLGYTVPLVVRYN